MTVLAWLRGPAPRSAGSTRLLAAQLSLLDSNVGVTLRTSVLAAWLTAAAFLYALNDTSVALWAVAVTLMCGVGVWCHRRLPRPELPGAEGTAEHYRRVMSGICLGLGGAWGMLPLLFIDAARPASMHIVVGVMAGLSSAGLLVFAPVWRLAQLFWLSCMLPMVVALLRWQDPVMTSLGLGGMLYLVAMALFARHTGLAVRRALALRLDNDDLVVQLREQTQQAQLARDLAEGAQQTAEEANRAKTLFLASASHDLRQPLHAAGLFLGSLARSGLEARQAMLLEHAQASNTAASEMLNTLLDFSKVGAGMIEPQPHSFALQPLFHKLERELAPWAADKGLVLRMRDTVATPFADQGMVELILRNLLLNAIRYTERGGVLLACRQRGGRAVIEVWDTGIGIPSESHQTIFHAFQQLGNPQRDRRNGLGLGLAIVQGLAKAMGVSVELVSRPGRGTVFRVSLPQGLRPSLAPERLPASAQALRGLRVLLIDDDESVRLAMSDLMGVWGVQCEVVASADAALQCLSRFVPDVVLADYRLRSAETGLQAVAAVRERLGMRVPAALVTGDTAVERLHDAQAQGLALLHKPVPADLLQSLLRDLAVAKGEVSGV
jgi:signal transduction histidine kinase/CheY-like chemotaxis protein